MINKDTLATLRVASRAIVFSDRPLKQKFSTYALTLRRTRTSILNKLLPSFLNHPLTQTLRHNRSSLSQQTQPSINHVSNLPLAPSINARANSSLIDLETNKLSPIVEINKQINQSIAIKWHHP